MGIRHVTLYGRTICAPDGTAPGSLSPPHIQGQFRQATYSVGNPLFSLASLVRMAPCTLRVGRPPYHSVRSSSALAMETPSLCQEFSFFPPSSLRMAYEPGTPATLRSRKVSHTYEALPDTTNLSSQVSTALRLGSILNGGNSIGWEAFAISRLYETGAR